MGLSDFVARLPTRSGGAHEARPTADDNEETIRHIVRYPLVRDRAIFIGASEDIVPDTVGGSGFGLRLLRKTAEAFPAARAATPDLLVIAVARPRIDPREMSRRPRREVRSYVGEPHRHVAAADLAIVQGGLTTCVELVASRRPFMYVQREDRFEQTFRMRARLNRFGERRCMS